MANDYTPIKRTTGTPVHKWLLDTLGTGQAIEWSGGQGNFMTEANADFGGHTLHMEVSPDGGTTWGILKSIASVDSTQSCVPFDMAVRLSPCARGFHAGLVCHPSQHLGFLNGLGGGEGDAPGDKSSA